MTKQVHLSAQSGIGGDEQGPAPLPHGNASVGLDAGIFMKGKQSSGIRHPWDGKGLEGKSSPM